MAWLNATPKPDARTKRGRRSDDDDTPLLSRIEQLKRQKVTPALPPVGAPHIVTRLIEIGLTEAAGMGFGPISWQTINAWVDASSVAIAPWEKRLLRRLSLEYVAEGRRAESENCPPPWRTEITSRERDAAEAQLRSVLG